MTIPAFWNESWTAAVVNHLWQSTVVVAIAWLLALALRKNHARVRYWIWLAASIKFLLPFSLLITAGEWLRSLIPAAGARPAIAAAMEQITQPFPQAQFLDSVGPSVASHHAHLLPVVLAAVWACGALIVLARFGRGWWLALEAKRAARPLELAADVPVLSSPTLIEPGIFGILRSVLLLPEGIVQKLTAAQLSAIIAHEMCHAHRRDNLTYSLHMLVEAIFWFHPAVWWIGSRLIDERERACDEAVVQAGSDARVYAEGILNVCKFYVESPVACVSGVTGADLKQRITRIMGERLGAKLTFGRKLLLGAAGMAAIAAPIFVGLGCVGQDLAQTHAEDANIHPIHFEVASIRQDAPDTRMMTFRALDDGVTITGAPVELLVQQAFGVEADQILGLPAWAKSDRYSIQAKVDDADVPRWKALRMARSKVAFQALLASRFSFKGRWDTRERRVYNLIVAKNGPKFREATPDDKYLNGLKKPDGSPMGPAVIMGVGRITIQGGSIAVLVKLLSNLGLGYPIEDRTSLTGRYDLQVHWAPNNSPASDNSGTSLFTALDEQLGLKLESKKEPAEVLVVDHIERPSPN